MKYHVRPGIVWLAATVALSGCGGGGGSTASAVSAAPPVAASATAPLTINVVVPRQTSSKHGPRYVSTSTQSMKVTLKTSGGAVYSTTTYACTATCTGTTGAPLGAITVIASLYDGASGAGNLLSTGSTGITVAPNTANTVNLTFNSVVNSVVLGVTAGAVNAGTSTTDNLTVTAKDADGNTIVGPGNFLDGSGNPLTLTVTKNDTGGSGSSSLGAGTTITAPPAGPITVTYNGGALGSSSYSVTPSSALAGSITPATITYTPTASTYSMAAGAGPTHIITGPDNNLWINQGIFWRLDQLTVPGGVLTVLNPGFSVTSGSVLGPDNNIWFTTTTTVGKYVVGGAFTSYGALTAAPSYIVNGADGNMWVSEGGGAKLIARVTTAGVITEFAVGAGSGQGLVAGPDGNIWMADIGASAIRKISTAGVLLATYPTVYKPDYGTVGPDGNLWFTEQGAIGKITTGGVLTEYPGAFAGGFPWEIISAADGNMYFAEHANNKLGKVTTAGAISEIDIGIPAAQTTWGISIGPDGNMYISGISYDTIVKYAF